MSSVATDRTDRPGAEGPDAVAETAGTQEAVARRRRSRRLRLVTIVVFGALMCLGPVLFTTDYSASVLDELLLYAVAGIGFFLILGLSGQFAFSQAAVFGIGAYASAWAGHYTGFWLSVLFAVFVACVVTALVGLLLRRTNELYFAIATLGVSQVCVIVFRQWTGFTAPGGEVALVNVPHVFGFVVNTPERYYWMCLVALTVALALATLIVISPLGRDTTAVRDRPAAAAGLGISVVRNRVTVYVLGSAFAALAGAFYAHMEGFISPDSFSLNLGIDLFLVVILGGLYSVWGAVLGAAFVVGVPEIARGAAEHRDLIFSVVLVVAIIAFPDGLIGAGNRLLSLAGSLTRRGGSHGA
ncbi:MAG TPA: branched-chain amino acid ABC transporter permease [Conexibacter sp.]